MAQSCYSCRIFSARTSPGADENVIFHMSSTYHSPTYSYWISTKFLKTNRLLLNITKLQKIVYRLSVLRSGSVRFFAPKTRNCGPQPVQDRPRYWGDRTGPPRTGLLRSTQPKKTGSCKDVTQIFAHIYAHINTISVFTIPSLLFLPFSYYLHFLYTLWNCFVLV
jgi:hypothetical protein